MAEAVGSVRIDLFANYAEFRDGLGKATAHLRRFEKDVHRTANQMQGAGARLGLAITAPLALFGAAAVKAAGEAQDLQGVFNLTFGDAAKEVDAWAEQTGDAMGRSTQTIQKTAIAFQEFFEDFAPSDKAARELSKTFTVLAQDFAAFRNVSDEQAFETLIKGASGSAKELKRLGVVINDEAVRAKALELGIAGANDKLTEQQKVLARSVIIAEGLKKVQGEVARSQGEVEEETKRAREEFKELLVTVGNEIVPIFTEFLKLARDLVKGFNSLGADGKRAVVVFGAIAAAAGPVVFILGSLVKVAAVATTGVRLLSASFVKATGAANTFAGAAGRALTALAAAPLVFEGGKNIVGFFHDAGPPIEEVRAHAQALVAELERLGISSQDAGNAVAQLLRSVGGDASKLTGEAALAIAKANGAMVQADPAATDLAGSVEDLVKSFGDLGTVTAPTADELQRIRDIVFPLDAAVREFNDNMKLAAAAGIDAGTASKAFGKDLVQSIGGVDVARENLEKLPPVIRDVLSEMDDAADQKDKIAAAFQAADDFLKSLEQERENAEREAERAKEALLDFAKDLTNEFDPAARFAEQMNRIDEAFRAGKISAEVYRAARDAAFAETPAGEAEIERLRQLDFALEDIADRLTDATVNGRNFGEVLKGIAIDALASNIIQPFFKNALSFGAGFLGKKDRGGPVMPGMAYGIGAGVSEVFVPDQEGEVFRGPGWGGKGMGSTVIQNIQTPTLGDFRNSRRQIARDARRSFTQ